MKRKMANKKARKGVKKEFDIKNFLKKNWSWIIVITILLFAFYLRAYHMNYPMIGYHNWKETNLMPKARTFAQDGFFEHGFFITESAFPPLDIQNSGYLNEQGASKDLFPTIEILTVPMFKIFGYELWAARLISILLSTFSLLFFYLFIRRISKNEFLALTTMFLLAVNPLLVFFGRNYQIINPALFFMSIALYTFFLWREEPKNKYLIWFAVSTLLSVLSKYNFAIVIGLVGLAFFPYSRLKEIKKYYKVFIISAVIILLIPAWMLYSPNSEDVTNDQAQTNAITATIGIVDVGYIFNPIFKNTFKPYIKDAFTILGAILSLIGVIVFGVYKFIKKKLDFFDKFMIVSFFVTIIYIILAASKIAGHVYHYYPVVFFITLFLAYLIVITSNTLSSFFKKDNLKIVVKIVVCVVFIFILMSGFTQAKNRMFDTQFPGIDIAGEYIKEHKGPTDRLVHSGHQAFGIVWHGDIKGSRDGISTDLNTFIYGEEHANVNWVFIYNWDFNRLNDQDQVWNYIRTHYSLKQIGFSNQQPLYLLLQKGGRFNETTINSELQKMPVQKKEYEYTFGKYYVEYINVE